MLALFVCKIYTTLYSLEIKEEACLPVKKSRMLYGVVVGAASSSARLEVCILRLQVKFKLAENF